MSQLTWLALLHGPLHGLTKAIGFVVKFLMNDTLCMRSSVEE